MTIAGKFNDTLTVQDYSRKPSIAGVEKLQLQHMSDDGGNFMEIARAKSGLVEGMAQPFEIQQISFSTVLPGAVKAYHIHKNQDDLWFVPPQHRLLVNLHDLREDSPTFDLHERVVLGGGKGMALRIPAGVAHGTKNCYDQPMFLFYATTTQFNIENPDEFRLPWDAFGTEVWEVTKG